MSLYPTDKQLAVGQAAVTWVATLAPVIALGLVSNRIHPGMTGGNVPRPPDPVVQCPRLMWGFEKSSNVGRPNAGVSFKWGLVAVYQRRQVPGQAHQELLLADLLALENCFLGQFNPEPLQEAGCDFVMPIEVKILPELDHPTREPRLRVSCGQIVFGLEARQG